MLSIDQLRGFLTLLFITILCTCVRAQACPDDTCGDLTVGFVPTSTETVFCEGASISFSNESVAGWDFFIIDWQDGTVDTVANYADISHEYNFPVPEPGQCNSPASFDIEFRGLKNCADGMSCHKGTLSYTVKPKPIARMQIPSEVCSGRPLTFNSTSCNAGTYLWDFGDGNTSMEEDPTHTYAMDGTYTVTLTITGQAQCGDASDMVSTVVEIVDPPNSEFLVSDDDLVACRGTEITFTNQSNSDTNIEWNISPGGNSWMFVDTNMTVNSEVITVIFNDDREYIIELIGRNACDEVRSEQLITIEEAPTVNPLGEIVACDMVTITPADLGYNVSGNVTSVCWEFTGGTGTATCNPNFGTATYAASGSVLLRVESLCGAIERTAIITIQSGEIPMLTAGNQYCTGSSPDTLETSIGGGDWLGPGITNGGLGIFAPAVAGAGNHTITYRITSGPCQNENTIMIEVVASEMVAVVGEEFCLDSGAADLGASPVGGAWSGEGITDVTAGTFDPALVSGAGTYRPVYSYEDVNGCMVEASPVVEVFTIPEVNGQDTALACLVNEQVSLLEITNVSADVSGGSYSWTVNGMEVSGDAFNPVTDLPGEGVYPVTYLFTRGPCSVPGMLFLQVIDNPVLELTPQGNVCISAGTITLQANLSGGEWSGPGVNPLTGEVNLVAAGGGSRTYTYTFQPGGSCEQSTTQTVMIEDPGADIMAGGDQRACEVNDLSTVLSGASPAGGIWSGPGLVDAMTGEVDLTQLVPGQSYEYTYELESSTAADCRASATKTLSYDEQPDPNYTLDGAPCIDEQFGLEALQTGTGFTYDWNFGDGGMSNQANPQYTYLSGGTFVQSLTVTSPEGCTADTTTTVYVTTPPSAAFVLDSTTGCAPFVLDLVDMSSGDDFTSNWLVNGDTLPGGGNLEYTIDGFFQDTLIDIVLVAENFCGARTQVQSVLVKPYPTVEFGLATDDGCSPFTPDISNVTRGNAERWFWDMGEGTTSMDSVPPVVNYTTPDDSVSVYDVQLIAVNGCGRDTLVEQVTVHPPDVRAFISLDTLAGCQPWLFQPRSFSTPGASLAWEITGPGGGSFASGNVADPAFELTEVGIHRVILRAARCGEDADTVFVNVLPAPEVSFTVAPAICLGEELLLTNTSIDIAGGIYDLGNGMSTNQVNTSVVYDSAANYTITFTGFSSLNNCPATASQDITVNALPAIAIAATDTAGCGPFITTLSNTAANAGTLTYDWDFGDGTNNSSEVAPNHTFDNTGDYFPTLAITDIVGCRSDTAFSKITVYPDPVPGFTIDNNRFCVGYDSLELTDISTGATALEWEIGGETYAGMPPVTAFDEANDFTVNLLAVNEFDCRASTSEVFTTLASPEAILAVDPVEVCLKERFNLSSNSTDATGVVWSLGDGTGQTDLNVSHVYAEAGDYDVVLVAENGNGCPADTAEVSITVHPLPVADYSVIEDLLCGTPADISFTNGSSGAISYDWEFGDGQSASSLNPTHTYTIFGTYQPLLIAETAFGCRDTTSREVVVSGAPVADFIRPPALGCAPYQLSLSAEPTEAIRYEWYVNDAFAPSVGEQFDTVLTDLGIYNLRLIAIFDDVCRDTIDVAEVLRLEARPTADFTFTVDALPNRLGDVRFTSLSVGGTELYWDLGDGDFETAADFLHEYRINGDIEVTHAVTQQYAQGLVCSDSITMIISPEWIRKFFVPNAISPESGPEEVRTWGAKGFGVADYRLEVYSTYGNIIYTTGELEGSQPTGRWDGVNPQTGAIILQGTYSWRAEVTYVDGSTENLLGTVTVIR
jgi:PKD repeat protein